MSAQATGRPAHEGTSKRELPSAFATDHDCFSWLSNRVLCWEFPAATSPQQVDLGCSPADFEESVNGIKHLQSPALLSDHGLLFTHFRDFQSHAFGT
jgi:hypothetical protein